MSPQDDTLNRSQQSRLFHPAKARPVTLIGAGTVGSHAAVMLAKIGVSDLTVWDADAVESHNVPSSAYRPKDLGRFKVDALAELVEEASGVRIKKIPRMYAGEPLRSDVLCCVDTMAARQAVWAQVRLNPRVGLLVDTRTAEEYVSVFAIRPSDPDDMEFYPYYLRYKDEETVRPTCGNHGIIHVGMQAAIAAVAGLTEHWKHGRKERHFQMLVPALTTIPS